jgi:hypothetical protein
MTAPQPPDRDDNPTEDEQEKSKGKSKESKKPERKQRKKSARWQAYDLRDKWRQENRNKRDSEMPAYLEIKEPFPDDMPQEERDQLTKSREKNHRRNERNFWKKRYPDRPLAEMSADLQLQPLGRQRDPNLTDAQIRKLDIRKTTNARYRRRKRGESSPSLALRRTRKQSPDPQQPEPGPSNWRQLENRSPTEPHDPDDANESYVRSKKRKQQERDDQPVSGNAKKRKRGRPRRTAQPRMQLFPTWQPESPDPQQPEPGPSNSQHPAPQPADPQQSEHQRQGGPHNPTTPPPPPQTSNTSTRLTLVNNPTTPPPPPTRGTTAWLLDVVATNHAPPTSSPTIAERRAAAQAQLHQLHFVDNARDDTVENTLDGGYGLG